jgi:hypothetical protein
LRRLDMLTALVMPLFVCGMGLLLLGLIVIIWAGYDAEARERAERAEDYAQTKNDHLFV